MLIIVTGSKEFRNGRIAAAIADYTPNEVIVFDDTLLGIADLEQYVYPSLFTIGAPMIHTQFLFDAKEKELTAELLKKIIASPTIFLFEELALSKPFLTNAKKQGAMVHEPSFAEASAGKAKKDNIFSVTNLITMQNKKERWLAYQKAIAQYPVEAILGMLYWKVRDMALKEKNNGPYHALYTAMIEAHAKAWIEGIPLALAIEKVLLTQ